MSRPALLLHPMIAQNFTIAALVAVVLQEVATNTRDEMGRDGTSYKNPGRDGETRAGEGGARGSYQKKWLNGWLPLLYGFRF